METPNNYFDAWMKSQQQAFATLREQATQMQSFYQNSATSSDNHFAAWSKAAFNAFAANSDADLAKNTLYKSWSSCGKLNCFRVKLVIISNAF